MTDALVTTAWLAQHAADPGLRIFEVSQEPASYASGHIEGALAIDWKADLIERADESSGKVIDAGRFVTLARKLAIQPDDTLVFYGDQGGRHATRALWTFEYYRHPGKLHWVDGGRELWQREGRPLTTAVPNMATSSYPDPPAPDYSIRATLTDLVAGLDNADLTVIDTRSPDEYAGSDIRSARGGRIPGARNVFWKTSLAESTALLPKARLEQLYAGVSQTAAVAAYCQLGVRAAHTWFILRHVLDHPDAKNYDGSWQEWGNLPDTPIEKETAP
ncbi:MAG: sulfurtransferase [Chloroflexi bacterium]|nr:sulfurtransferase [Chloroflexota bacterium]